MCCQMYRICISFISKAFPSNIQTCKTSKIGNCFQVNMASADSIDENATNEEHGVNEEVKEEEESMVEMKILCVGDSLTWGYNNGGMKQYPYKDTLEMLLKEQFGDSVSFNVFESGVSGELVTETMVDRIADILSNNTFDVVVHLGGTNDIGYMKAVEKICKSLGQIYQLIAKHKAHCIAVTVPPCLNAYDSIDGKREKVNEYILKQPNVVDLFSYIQGLSNVGDESEREAFFDYDGLHFSKSGYQQLGNLVYESIKSVVESAISK